MENGRKRVRSLRNLLTMGHCAPAVMKTITEIEGAEREWTIRFAGGLPGGIGDTGFECGGITSPLVQLGLRYRLEDESDGLPLLFHKGHDYFRRFLAANGSWRCWDIRGEKNFRLRRCIRAVVRSPELYLSTVFDGTRDAIPDGTKEAYARLYSHFKREGFHCAHAVLRRLNAFVAGGDELLAGTSGFVGGTLMLGRSCSALAAGVMAIGLQTAEIENSFPRVLRMIVLMKTGGHPFEDRINKFNRAMNLGNRLAGRFAGKFGGTQCRAVAGSDFSSCADVTKFIETGSLSACAGIADWVAGEVKNVLREAGAGRQPA